MLGVHALGDKVGEREDEVCPQCREKGPLEVYALLTRIVVIPLPQDEVLRCPQCDGFSRHEPLWKRVGGIIILTPFVGLLAVGVGTGAYFAGKMFFGDIPFSASFLFIAAILVGVAGYIGWRAARFGWRLATSKELLTLTEVRGQGGSGFGTKID